MLSEQSNSKAMFMTDEQFAEYRRKQADMHDRLMAAFPEPRSDKERIAELEAQLAAVLPELDVLCEYTGQNGMREWNDVGAWLRPGECIAVVAAPKAQADPCHKKRNQPCQCSRKAMLCDGFGPDAAQAEKQELVAFVHRNEAGQISMKASDGGNFDMSKFIGSSLYTHPQPDLTAEVERIGKAFSKEVSEWRKLTMQQQRRVAAPNKRHGECSPSILTTGLSGRKEDK